jgi:hypothetical protein
MIITLRIGYNIHKSFCSFSEEKPK